MPWIRDYTRELGDLRQRLVRIERGQQLIILKLEREITMSAATQQVINDLKAELERNTSATASVQTAIDTLVQQMQDAVDDPAELQALLDGFKANTDSIAAAALKGTPAEGQ